MTLAGFAWAGLVAADRAGQLRTGDLIPALIVQGFGEGLFMTPLLAQVLGGVPTRFVGTASGALSTAQQIGGAIGVALISLVFFPAIGHQSAPAGAVTGRYAHAFALAMIFTGVVIAVAEGLLLLLPTASGTGSPADGDRGGRNSDVPVLTPVHPLAVPAQPTTIDPTTIDPAARTA
jgi:MFS family permease